MNTIRGSRQILERRKYQLIKMNGNKCHWCGKETLIIPEQHHNQCTVDHVIPVRQWVNLYKKHPSAIENLVIACYSCNHARGAEYHKQHIHPSHKKIVMDNRKKYIHTKFDTTINNMFKWKNRQLFGKFKSFCITYIIQNSQINGHDYFDKFYTFIQECNAESIVTYINCCLENFKLKMILEKEIIE